MFARAWSRWWRADIAAHQRDSAWYKVEMRAEAEDFVSTTAEDWSTKKRGSAASPSLTFTMNSWRDARTEGTRRSARSAQPARGSRT